MRALLHKLQLSLRIPAIADSDSILMADSFSHALGPLPSMS
jgi:hypothetical protein